MCVCVFIPPVSMSWVLQLFFHLVRCLDTTTSECGTSVRDFLGSGRRSAVQSKLFVMAIFTFVVLVVVIVVVAVVVVVVVAVIVVAPAVVTAVVA